MRKCTTIQVGKNTSMLVYTFRLLLSCHSVRMGVLSWFPTDQDLRIDDFRTVPARKADQASVTGPAQADTAGLLICWSCHAMCSAVTQRHWGKLT